MCRGVCRMNNLLNKVFVFVRLQVRYKTILCYGVQCDVCCYDIIYMIIIYVLTFVTFYAFVLLRAACVTRGRIFFVFRSRVEKHKKGVPGFRILLLVAS